jgi:addiction module HigA family antidote
VDDVGLDAVAPELLGAQTGRIQPTREPRGKILAGRRAIITADTDLRLCRFFGLSDGWWLRLQADFDTEVAKGNLAKALAKIKPWKETAEQNVDAH